ncbi:MAG TPA: S8 family serine peptidase [Novosphingobium sp.]|nr:S8 family serine peptidase [Novosphingobium sp.]
MSQYVVFVDEDLVAGSVQMLADTGDGAAAQPMMPTAAEQIAFRRTVLGGIASAMAGHGAAGPAMMAASANSAMAAAADVGVSASAPDPDAGIQILEGANAIVVDEDAVNIAALRKVVGLTVFPNIQISLPRPIVLEASAMPAPDWHLDIIGATGDPAAGRGILIGVLDTGIDAAHSEFAGKTIHFQEFDAAGQKVAGGPRDAGEHGTHVCSTIAGKTAGVAPGADLAVAAVLTNDDGFGRMSGSLVQIVNGFDWLVKTAFRTRFPGVDVINASLGGRGFNGYLQTAVRSAFAMGIPLVAAVGNSGRSGQGNHGSPANYPNVLSVGASDVNDRIAEFSDWGTGAPPTGPSYPLPELCAPGVDVHAAKPGGGFQRMSGTSMATPVVTGVAARRMAATPTLIGKPGAIFADLRTKLAPYAQGPLGNQGGAGRIIA